MQLDVQHRHADEAKQHGQGHEGTDDQAGTHAQEQHDHNQYDGQSLGKVDEGTIDGPLHQNWLKGGIFEEVAEGQGLLDLLKTPCQTFAELDRIDAIQYRNTQDDCRATIKKDGLVGRIHIIAVDADDVLERDRLIAIRQGDEDGCNLVHIVKGSRRLDDNILAISVDDAAWQQYVLIPERFDDHPRPYAESRHPGVRDLEKDAFLLDAEGLDLFHALEGIEATPRVAGDFAHFLKREAVAPQGDRRDRRQAEVIIDERANGPRR